jgi:hypothetical protein
VGLFRKSGIPNTPQSWILELITYVHSFYVNTSSSELGCCKFYRMQSLKHSREVRHGQYISMKQCGALLYHIRSWSFITNHYNKAMLHKHKSKGYWSKFNIFFIYRIYLGGEFTSWRPCNHVPDLSSIFYHSWRDVYISAMDLITPIYLPSYCISWLSTSYYSLILNKLVFKNVFEVLCSSYGPRSRYQRGDRGATIWLLSDCSWASWSVSKLKLLLFVKY